MEEEESEATLFQAKKLCSGEPYNPSSAQGHDLNFPLPDEKGLPCLVKVSILFAVRISVSPFSTYRFTVTVSLV